MKTLARFAPILFLLFLASCAGLYSGVVTLTSVVDQAAKDYAKLYNDGLIPPDVATKAGTSYEAYRKSAGVAKQALIAYKASGDPAQHKAALEAARTAANAFVDVVLPYESPAKALTLQTQLKKASAP